jgi:hypothetical protein
MRRSSLQAIHSRVDRIAASRQADEQDLIVIVHEIIPYDRCAQCGCDLVEHSRMAAVAKAQAEDGPGASPRRFISVCWDDDRPTCPACGAPFPDPVSPSA